jgi:hypothetical protein
MWEAAGQDPQEEAMKVLVAYLKRLTPNHRANVRAAIAVHRAGKGAIPKVFFAKLEKALGSG